MILTTGGAGFIGSNFVLDWIQNTDEPILNLDLLTYAGNLENLKLLEGNSNYIFVQGDICNRDLVLSLLKEHKPRTLINFAAESHVDRSIEGPSAFIKTNIEGTFSLLEAARAYYENYKEFKFIHVSTDEVYGSLDVIAPAFTETTPYSPNSPYAASKASSDHLVRAWHHTYNLPVITTNCSNNYGPYQFPEKLIPLTILNALNNKPIPIYGDGNNIRDWLYVDDHCSAIRTVLENGKIGETYNIGGNNEIKNIDIVNRICEILDDLKPNIHGSYKKLITFVKDRPGHDKRYAINASKIKTELNWSPSETFETGIVKTILWYLNNQEWVQHVQDHSYTEWINKNYLQR